MEYVLVSYAEVNTVEFVFKSVIIFLKQRLFFLKFVLISEYLNHKEEHKE